MVDSTENKLTEDKSLKEANEPVDQTNLIQKADLTVNQSTEDLAETPSKIQAEPSELIEEKSDLAVTRPKKKKKTTKKKSKKKKDKDSSYSKGVETLYRNAYRLQLDMISLAATKANIMISLNGFIVSILMVSGSFIIMYDPDFLIPIVVFLVTSAASIYFALTSASPEAPARKQTLSYCLWSLFTRRINWKQFNKYREQPKNAFDKKESNILTFSDYAKVSKEFYLECMDELIKDPDMLYKKMSDQLYYLGKLADKKFTSLRYSYTIFRWGLLLSIFVFISLRIFHIYFPHISVASTNLVVSSGIKLFDNIYEPSGIERLKDGRLVVVEDEASQALHILDVKPDGGFEENKSLTWKLMRSFKMKLNDLEAIALGPDDYIYAITSHQRNLSGERSADREQLIRFKIDGNTIVGAASYGKLTSDIDKSGILGPVDEQGKGGIHNMNIEALSFDHKGRLLIGFRAPLNGSNTIIGILENPVDIFEYKAKPIINKKPLLLDLYGGGIRALYYDKALNGYLISNEVYGEGKNRSQILYWDGNKTHTIHRMGKPGVSNIEGITAVGFGSNRKILLSNDDGSKIKGKNASYLYLKYIDLSKKKIDKK